MSKELICTKADAARHAILDLEKAADNYRANMEGAEARNIHVREVLTEALGGDGNEPFAIQKGIDMVRDMTRQIDGLRSQLHELGAEKAALQERAEKAENRLAELERGLADVRPVHTRPLRRELTQALGGDSGEVWSSDRIVQSVAKTREREKCAWGEANKQQRRADRMEQRIAEIQSTINKTQSFD